MKINKYNAFFLGVLFLPVLQSSDANAVCSVNDAVIDAQGNVLVTSTVNCQGGSVRVMEPTIDGEYIDFSGETTYFMEDAGGLVNGSYAISSGVQNFTFTEGRGELHYKYDKDFTIGNVLDLRGVRTSTFIVVAFDSTLTTGGVMVGELDVRSGTLDANVVEANILNLRVGDLMNASRDNSSLVSSDRYIDVSNLNVEFVGTSAIGVGSRTQEISLLNASNGINVENTDSIGTLNSALFDVELDTDNELFLDVVVERVNSYESVVSENGGSDLHLEMARLFDAQLGGTHEGLNSIMEAIDNNTEGGEEVVQSFEDLQPISSRVYSNILHTNTFKLATKLSDNLTRVSGSSPWVSGHYSFSSLDSKGDVIGYDQHSGGAQVGYSMVVDSLTFGLSGSYIRGALENDRESYYSDYNNYHVSLGLKYDIMDGLYANAVLAYSYSKFATEKEPVFLGSDDSVHAPDYDVDTLEVLGRVELGYHSTMSNGIYVDYSAFYSLGSANIGEYSENGISEALSVEESTPIINDVGLSAMLSKNVLSSVSNASLSPFVKLIGGFRDYNGTETDFHFMGLEDDSFEMNDGDYNPLYMIGSVGVSYAYNSTSVSLGYTLDTNIKEHMDNTVFINLAYNF